jgi:putative FmdB family regulatory protein
MPTYEYICLSCSKESEVSCSISEYDRTVHPDCPHCGSSEALQRHYRSNPTVTIPSHMKAVVGRSKEAPELPINFIKPKADGSYDVTRYGRKCDL